MLRLTRVGLQTSVPLWKRSNIAHVRRSSLTKCCSSQSTVLCRHFSAEVDESKKKKDLRESIEKLKNDNTEESKNEETKIEMDPRLERMVDMAGSFVDSISQTWQDLVSAGAAKDINKKIGTPVVNDDSPNFSNDDEAADKYEEYKGSKDIMLIDPEEHLSAWERMQRRLKDAPIIQGEPTNELCAVAALLRIKLNV